MTKLAMTSATGFGPLPQLLETRAGTKALVRAFALEDLPIALIEDRAHRVPLRALIGVFDRAARLAGDPLLGLHVGIAMSPGDYGCWVRYALQAPTLAGAVSRLSRCIILHQVGGALTLEHHDDATVLWGYRQDAVAGTVAVQHADHILPVMVKVVRAYCGVDWVPLRVESSAAWVGREATEREDVTCAPWRFGAAVDGIVLPAAALWARRVPPQEAVGDPWLSSREVLAEVRMRQREGGIERLAAILALRLLDGRTDIDGAARMAGLGRRTLQRLLDAEGKTYRTLLDRVRMDRARALIRETETPLWEIAELVGYSDPAHFSRAFSRYFGHPPSAERKTGSRKSSLTAATKTY